MIQKCSGHSEIQKYGGKFEVFLKFLGVKSKMSKIPNRSRLPGPSTVSSGLSAAKKREFETPANGAAAKRQRMAPPGSIGEIADHWKCQRRKLEHMNNLQ